MEKIIYGGDTETVNGKPNSIQIYSEDIPCSEIMFVNEHTARKKFLAWCAKRKRKCLHVIYIHNLKFDLIELLWGKHEHLAPVAGGGDFELHTDGFDIRGFYGAPTFCSMRKGSDIHIILADSFSFYRGSLAQAATLYCPQLPKLRRPVGLGSTRYNAASKTFVEYAMRDAEVTYHIGRAIEALHVEFDLKQCISVADMAARVFRHHFLSYTIPQPSSDCIYAALDSYHGGKNNIACDPGWYPKAFGIDISSAYPHAMHDMPAFSNASLYKKYRSARSVKRVPAYGVYKVSGIADACKWPVVFTHAFKPMRGEFSEVWIQGYELNEALESGELKLSRISGWYYDAEKDLQAPALRGFCETFYRRKQQEKDKVRRYGYKLMLNSISGKFIQTRKKTLSCYVDIDTGEVSNASELVAGGMFHPFIASAITAHTRARIHGLEHTYKALHTATDGIFTTKRPGKEVTRGDATKLGELVCDAEGELLIVRNKLYIMYDQRGEIESRAFHGKRIAKYALHGFQGRVGDLEVLIATGRRKYKVNRPNTLRESLVRGLTPNDFRERDMTLKVGPLKVQL